MAQILEAQGILVTVALIEGDPEILTDWAEHFQSNDKIINKLKSINSSFSNEVTKIINTLSNEPLYYSISEHQACFPENTVAVSRICLQLNQLYLKIGRFSSPN